MKHFTQLGLLSTIFLSSASIVMPAKASDAEVKKIIEILETAPPEKIPTLCDSKNPAPSITKFNKGSICGVSIKIANTIIKLCYPYRETFKGTDCYKNARRSLDALAARTKMNPFGPILPLPKTKYDY